MATQSRNSPVDLPLGAFQAPEMRDQAFYNSLVVSRHIDSHLGSSNFPVDVVLHPFGLGETLNSVDTLEEGFELLRAGG
jgi:hypothetical protein